MKVSIKHSCNDVDSKTKVLREKTAPVQFCPSKIPMKWPGIATGTPQ